VKYVVRNTLRGAGYYPSPFPSLALTHVTQRLPPLITRPTRTSCRSSSGPSPIASRSASLVIATAESSPVMNAERVNNFAPARCPRCAQPMRLVRRTLRFNGLPDLYAFECKKCGVSHIEEGGPPREITPSKAEISSWYLDEFGNPTREIKRRE
jgi:hypothetical protein